MKYGFYVHRLASYEYCPARYRLEVSDSKNEPTSKFEVLQILFTQYFKTLQLKNKNVAVLERSVEQYKHLLFPEGDVISARVMVAYLLKCFEAIRLELQFEQSAHVPNTYVLPFEGHSLKLTTDLIYVDSHLYKKRLNFCYLVPNDQWDSISLSNRFEAAVTKKLLIPMMDLDKNITQRVVYINPEKGMKFEQPLSGMSFTASMGRLKKVCKDIADKSYIRRPSMALCQHCPVIEQCKPRGQGESKYILPPLDLT